MKKNRIGIMAFAGLGFLFLSVQKSHAYLDPGTGSMLIQGLLAAVAAMGVTLGIFWRRIKAFFGGFSKSDAEKQNETNGE